MSRGRRRELWDMTALLRYDIISSGYSRPKRLPKPEDLNPIRVADGENEEENDILEIGNKILAQAQALG